MASVNIRDIDYYYSPLFGMATDITLWSLVTATSRQLLNNNMTTRHDDTSGRRQSQPFRCWHSIEKGKTTHGQSVSSRTLPEIGAAVTRGLASTTRGTTWLVCQMRRQASRIIVLKYRHGVLHGVVHQVLTLHNNNSCRNIKLGGSSFMRQHQFWITAHQHSNADVR